MAERHDLGSKPLVSQLQTLENLSSSTRATTQKDVKFTQLNDKQEKSSPQNMYKPYLSRPPDAVATTSQGNRIKKQTSMIHEMRHPISNGLAAFAVNQS